MALEKKYEHSHKALLRDVRPLGLRIAEALATPAYATSVYIILAVLVAKPDMFGAWTLAYSDLLFILGILYFWWLTTRNRDLAFKMPIGSKWLDGNNGRGGKPGKPEGILYLGNVEKTNEEIWFTNSDARTHILYLGTTGAGKTEGLKSMVSNALGWGSGFVYVDGKADTDLWSSLSSLVRRFGRDDDLLVLNYMTGNSDVKAPSNTMNPFSSGSASYLTNMLVSLMPEAQGDNAMWSERAISLVGAMMPVMTYKRDKQDMPMSVRTIRENLSLNNVIKFARDETVPEETRDALVGYLDTLPGFVHEAYDENGQVKPPGPDTPQYDTTTANQQHGYLAMQFTRSLQSLGDDYGYIFDTQAADVDMVDVVLNRRVLVVLIPALEKSTDEIANLGKIVAATIKGMMGSTLGANVEGDSASVIENKPTHAPTPFMTVFDEVGYYTAKGMAVMAAQARSLGFCLIFSGQDLPAMKKLVREEANSITANCNIKVFGKLEDPTDTKDFFEKTVGQAFVTEVSGFQMQGGSETRSYFDTHQAGVQLRPRASYDGLRGFIEGQAVVTFGESVVDAAMFYSNPGFAKAMRVTRFMALPPPDENLIKHADKITSLRDLLVDKSWTAIKADVAVETPPEIDALVEGYRIAEKAENKVDTGICSLIEVYKLDNELPPLEETTDAAQPAQGAPVTPQTPQSPDQSDAAAPNTAQDATDSTAATSSSAEVQAPPDGTPTIFSAPPAQSPQEAPQDASVSDQNNPNIPPTTPPADIAAQETPSSKTDAGQEAASQGEGGSANPMGFFSKTPPAQTPEAPATQAPQNTQETPQQQTPPTSVAPEQPQTPQTPPSSEQPSEIPASSSAQEASPAQSEQEKDKAKIDKIKLPPEIEDALKVAGKETGKALFKEENTKNKESDTKDSS